MHPDTFKEIGTNSCINFNVIFSPVRLFLHRFFDAPVASHELSEKLFEGI